MTTDLALRDTTQYLATNPEASGITLQELMDANVGNGGFSISDITKVSVPGAGGMTWAIPHPNGEIGTRELVGVILFGIDPRAYYKYKPGDTVPESDVVEGANLPDCASDDGITGQATSVGVKRGMAAGPVACETCPLAQWGSAKGGAGKGKACAERRDLFMLLPDRLLPIIVTAPSTSLQDVRAYMNGLMQFAKPIYSVETKLTLMRHENGAIKWSTIVASKSADLSPDAHAQMKKLSTQFRSLLVRAPRQSAAVAAA